MSKNNFLKSFNDVNEFLNNTNTFLLDISLPIINYLVQKNDDFETIIKQACRHNRRFASGSLAHDIFEKTNDFLMCMSTTSEYVGCDCHNKAWAEFHQEIADPLHEYSLFLLHIVNESDFNKKLIALSSDFGNDYIATRSSLMENRIELTQAERAVLYWQGAVPDGLIQESILQLRYGYIKKLMQSL